MKTTREMLKIHLIPSSLQSMAMNTISLELWKQPDIVSELKCLFDDESLIEPKKWSKIQERVVEKMFLLLLPDLLKPQLYEAIDTIGLRITVWLKKVIDLLPRNNIPDYIRLITLNSYGEIDRKKTAASILKTMKNMDPFHLYCFACFNCLEDDVHSLWKELPVKDKNFILDNEKGFIQENSIRDIVIYWSCCISQNFDPLHKIIQLNLRRSDNINDYFIWYSIQKCNSASFQYFWGKFSEEEKRRNIVKYAIELCSCVQSSIKVINELFEILVGDSVQICNILGSQMDEVQLKEMFAQEPYLVLHLWCWCEYWNEGLISLDSIWNIISDTHFRMFVLMFVRHRLLCPSESQFFMQKDRRIFKELWVNTPNNIKRRYLENVSMIERIIDSLIVTADVENLHLIFDDATVEEREKIINHSYSRHLFVSVLEMYCSHSRRHADNMTGRHLTEEEIDDLLEDILSSFKQVKGDLWPLLNNLNKWKTGTIS